MENKKVESKKIENEADDLQLDIEALEYSFSFGEHRGAGS